MIKIPITLYYTHDEDKQMYEEFFKENFFYFDYVKVDIEIIKIIMVETKGGINPSRFVIVYDNENKCFMKHRYQPLIDIMEVWNRTRHQLI